MSRTALGRDTSPEKLAPFVLPLAAAQYYYDDY
jgi:hypothetical protein